jgi:hypothetical protein
VGEIAHAAVTRRPLISLDTMVHRTEGNAYDVGVWDLSTIRAIICHAVSYLRVTIRNFCIAVCDPWHTQQLTLELL